MMLHMEFKLEIDQASLQALQSHMHPKLYCPFCKEWTVCAGCASTEMVALNWMVHMIDAHYPEIAAARVAAEAGGSTTAHKYFVARLNGIAAEHCGSDACGVDHDAIARNLAEQQASVQETTTETADAPGD